MNNSTWKADWKFSNVFHRNHGKSGSIQVVAANRKAAFNAICEKASKVATGTTMFYRSIVITNLHTVRHQYGSPEP